MELIVQCLRRDQDLTGAISWSEKKALLYPQTNHLTSCQIDVLGRLIPSEAPKLRYLAASESDYLLSKEPWAASTWPVFLMHIIWCWRWCSGQQTDWYFSRRKAVLELEAFMVCASCMRVIKIDRLSGLHCVPSPSVSNSRTTHFWVWSHFEPWEKVCGELLSHSRTAVSFSLHENWTCSITRRR